MVVGIKKWHYLLLCLVFLSLGSVLALPFFYNKDDLETIREEVTVNIEQQATTGSNVVWHDKSGVYNYWNVEGNTFGISSGKELNDSFIEDFIDAHLKTQLNASATGTTGTWLNASEGLTTNITWDAENDSAKITWVINTTTAPVPLFYRLTFAIDQRCTNYINDSGIDNYSVQFDIPFDDETVSFVFNWSDIIPLIQSNQVRLSRGRTTIGNDSFFYFRLWSNNKINPDVVFEIDPSFGYTGSGSYHLTLEGRLCQSQFYHDGLDGNVDNISVRIRRDFGLGNTNARCAIYDGDDTLINETEEIALTPDDNSYKWITFEFDDGYEPLLTPGWYNLTIFCDNQFVSIDIHSILTSNYDGFGYNATSYTNHPETGTFWQWRTSGVMSIYASYTHNATAGLDTAMNNFSHNRKITINHSYVDGDLTNFPILFRNTSSNFSTHARPDGADFVFMNETNETQYNHEIDNYDNSTGELIAWVNITNLSSTVDTVLWLHYGNATTGTMENVTGTWDSGFIGVWHMDGTYYENTLLDSTSNGNDAVASATPLECAGLIGRGQDYDADTDYFTVSDDASLDAPDVTMTCWQNLDSLARAAYVSRNYVAGDYYFQHGNSNRFHFIWDDPGGTNTEYQSYAGTTILTTDNWHFVGFTRDDTAYEVEYYCNSSDQTMRHRGSDSYTSSDSPDESNDDLYFGAEDTNPGYGVDGQQDEIRLSNVERSKEWIFTEYNTSWHYENFLTVSEVSTPSPPTGESWQQNFTGWWTGGNVSSYQQNFTGWWSGGNDTVVWQQNFTGWWTGGNVSSYQQNFTGFWTGGNISSYQQNFTGWWTGGNISNYRQNFTGWWTGGNTTEAESWKQNFTGWWTGGNVSSYQQNFTGWWSGGNDTVVWQQNFTGFWSGGNDTVVWQQNFTGWWTGGNVSSYQQNFTGFWTGGNISRTYQQNFTGWWTGGNVSVFFDIIDEFPTNLSSIYSPQPTLYFTLTHPDSNLMNYTIYTGNSSVNCTSFLASAVNVSAGIHHFVNYFNATGFYTDYFYAVHADDGSGWVNETYNFKVILQSSGQSTNLGSVMALAAGAFAVAILAFIYAIKRRRKR